MRKLIYFIFMLVVSAGILKAMPDPHDSLLFDGAENITINTDEDCALEVVASGSVEAVVRVKVEALGCGEGPDSVYGWKRIQVKTGDFIKAGEEIVTGSDGYLKIPLSDGSVIVVDKNSRFTPDKNICNLLEDNVSRIIGRVWTRIKKALGGAKYEVQTERTGGGVRGTEFSVESNEKWDIIKVYKGIVEVKPTKVVLDKILDRKESELKKTNEDFQNGKMPMEDYIQKVTEISNEIQNVQEKTNIVVDAGYKYTIDSDGNIIGPEPIESDDDKWWEK